MERLMKPSTCALPDDLSCQQRGTPRRFASESASVSQRTAGHAEPCVTETLFEKPGQLLTKHIAQYRLLLDCYYHDPAH
jgi:hypothetical protein